MQFRVRPLLHLGAALFVLAGCSWFDAEPEAGFYRATLEVPGGKLPFGLEILPDAQGNLQAFLIEGGTRLPVTKLTRREREIELLLPGSRNTLTFTARGSELSGTLDLVVGSGERQTLAFRAEHDVAYRFFPEASLDNADVAGRWSATLVRNDGSVRELVANFVQAHDQVAGTLYDGDNQQALTGQIRDEELRLSAFDGRVAILVVATVNDSGELEGDYWSSATGASNWRAWRNPDAVIEAEPAPAGFQLYRNH